MAECVVPVGDAHSGAVHGVHVGAADAQRDPLEALRRGVAARFGPGPRIVLAGPPWRPLDAESAREAAAAAAALGHEGPEPRDVRVFVYDRGVIKGDAPGADDAYALDAEAGRQVGFDVRVPKTLNEARAAGLVSRTEAVAEDDGSEAGSPGDGPLQRALGDFATQFKLRLAQGRAYARAADARARACEGLAARATIRAAALSAALANLGEHGHSLATNQGQLRERAARHGEVQREALERFEDDLEALSSVALHPALAAALDAQGGAPDTAEPRTLAECVPADRVRRWAEHCARTLAAFEADGERLATSCADVAARVDAVAGPRAGALRAARLDAVAADAACCGALAARQRGLVEALGYDERDASRVVARERTQSVGGAPESGSSELSGAFGTLDDDFAGTPRRRSSSRSTPSPPLGAGGDDPWEATEAMTIEDEGEDPAFGRASASALPALSELQARWEKRERLLPAVRATEKALAGAARRCASGADALAQDAVAQLRAVADLQSKIHAARSRHLGGRGDKLKEKAAAFAQLDAVRRLPKAHAALCLEVARRRAYGRAALAAVRSAAEEVARLREAEVKRRAAFARTHGARLPRSLLRAVPGLADAPSAFSPTFRPEAAAAPLPDVRLEELTASGGFLPPGEARARAWSCDSAVDGRKSSSDVTMEPADAGSLVLAGAGEGASDDDDGDSVDEVAQLRARVARLECELADARQKALDPPAALRQRSNSAVGEEEAPAPAPEEGPKISFTRFAVGDVALFLPTGGPAPRAYLAFHHGCPHRYLATESADAIRAAHRRDPDFILGRVTVVQVCEAGPTTEANPYRLPVGTEFHVLAVESL